MAAPENRSRWQNNSRRKRSITQARLGQHFFTSRSVARRIILSMNLQHEHNLLELGAGESFFTALLAREVRTVTASEIHDLMISRLIRRFQDVNDVSVVKRDITLGSEFGYFDVIFGNIPFDPTAEIFRKILKSRIRPFAFHLIVQTEAAYRLTANGPPAEMSLNAYPFFDIQLGISIPNWAYSPRPSVRTSVLHIRTRHTPMIKDEHAQAFRKYSRRIVRSDTRKLFRTVGRDVSYARWRRITRQINIDVNVTRADLDLKKFVELFNAIVG